MGMALIKKVFTFDLERSYKPLKRATSELGRVFPMPYLQKLSICSVEHEFFDTDIFANFLDRHPSLTEIPLSQCHYSGIRPLALTHERQLCPMLESLSLTDCYFNDAALYNEDGGISNPPYSYRCTSPRWSSVSASP
ncbi:hypothetical protein BOTBODRAFT_464760 [Botryobasidium botryosum FD-172 SS1]|uniref:F-box domain-containing protein n=1 Tax=Botryobasidium botryosum (strain FD-172 SS1) TaxID=930990 RepID=A0A067M5J5_BOTB1|nr:hypothetical protein BOTBODRAFT_464760 [Botryobasidium botryosum FD-172 SS1]